MPLYSLFGPDAVHYRLDDADAKAIVTSSAHVDKIDPDAVDALEHILIVDGDGNGSVRKFGAMDASRSDYSVADTYADDTCTIQYTSGTTGPPKGVEVRHAGIVALSPSFVWAADQRPSDEYFGAAPPAWSYGLFGCTAFPLHRGMGTTAYRGRLAPGVVVDVLETYGITNFFAPPTLLRQLINSSIDFETVDHELRIIATGGEPLDPSTVEWVRDSLGAKIIDHYGFTEGSMVINNYAFDDWEVKPGNMGKPCPGYEVRILDTAQDTEVPQGEVGEIAIRTDAPFPESGISTDRRSQKRSGAATGCGQVILPSQTRIAISGSKAEPTTSSSVRDTESGRPRWKTP